MRRPVMVIIYGHVGSDAGWTEVDTLTGKVIIYPGNRGGGGTFDEVRNAALIIKHAAEIKDTEFQKRTIQAAGEYLNKKTEILSPSGNIIAIF
jgi:hypothetical protein